MKLMLSSDMHLLDQKAIAEYKIPGILLMEHAAYHLFKHLEQKSKEGHTVIVCGPGNNGGDGLALARQLTCWGKGRVTVLMLAKEEQLTTDGKVYYDICQKLQLDIIKVTQHNRDTAFELLSKAKVIVDALFGTGLTREISSIYAEVIAHINKCSGYVLSVDIPSGIDGSTGKIRGICIKANYTITFTLPKVGLYLYPALLYTGLIEVVDIGIPKALLEEAHTSIFALEKEEMKELLPSRKVRSNKGSYGKVLVLGGSVGLSGAVALTSRAAYQVGSGTVTVGVPYAILNTMEQKLTEVMKLGFSDEEGHFSEIASKEVEEILSKFDVIAIGPGIGRSEAILPLLKKVLVSDKPCVIDADALYFIPYVEDLLHIRKAPTLLTPHPGEMARLTGLSIKEILDCPLEIARDYAMRHQVITLLKTERTVIADTNGDIYINRYGNSGLAKGGSGDVLTGTLAGLLAQHISAIDSSKLGCFLHARAGDLAREELTEYSFLPSDIINYFSKVFKELV